MTLTKQTAQFVAPSGKALVYLSDLPMMDSELLFSPDGVTFYALASSGFSGNAMEHKLSFYDPHRGVSGELHRDGDTIGYNGERYTEQDVTFNQSSVVPLPATRRTEYLCQAKDGTLFYVSAKKYNYSYESFKLFVGDGTTMREIQVQRVERYRDGGTTYIFTSEETFFSPSPLSVQQNPELVPQWGSQKLSNLDRGDYVIVETPDEGVSITKS